MFINVTIYYESVDVTEHVISFHREKTICSGIGTASVVFDRKAGLTFGIYKEVIIYEEGHKKGVFRVATIQDSVPTGTVTLMCQDDSKKLQDTFITETEFVDYYSFTGNWIADYLELAQVYYSINAGSSEPLSNNTTLGMQTVFDQVQSLLQMNGWFLYFDANSVAQVGKFELDLAHYDFTLTDEDIIDLTFIDEDKFFRNRAVIYAGVDPSTMEQIVVDYDLHGGNQVEYNNSTDIRSVVIANGNIPTQDAATGLAYQLMKEFHKVIRTCIVQISGELNVDLGSQVLVDSRFGNLIGTVTNIVSDFSENGFITTLTLNTRCPRIFGYFNFGSYYYVGTEGQGVWRRPILYKNVDWEDYSTGLNNLYIKDLSVAGGVLSCIDENGTLYSRYPNDSAWTVITGFATYDEITEESITTTEGHFTGCVVDRQTHAVLGTYSALSAGEPRSWLVAQQGRGNIVSSNVVVSGENNFAAFDMDNDGYASYVTVDRTTSSGTTTSGIYNHMMNRVTNWDNSYMQDQEFTNHTGHIKVSNSSVEPLIVNNGNIYTYTFVEGDYLYNSYYYQDEQDIYHSGMGRWRISTGEFIDYVVDIEETGDNWVNYWTWYPYGAQASPGVIWFSGDTDYNMDNLAVAKVDFNTHTMTRIMIRPYISDLYTFYQGHVQVIGTTLFVFYSYIEYSGAPDWNTTLSEYRCAIIDLTTETITGDHILDSSSNPDADLTNNDLNQYITTVDDTVMGLFGYPDRFEPQPPPYQQYNEKISRWMVFGINTSGEHNTTLLAEVRGTWGDMVDFISGNNILCIIYPDYANHCAVMAFRYEPDYNDSVEIRQINKDGTSYRKYGTSPLYVDTGVYDPTNPRYAMWSFVAGKNAVYPIAQWNGGTDVYDVDGVYYLHRCDDEYYHAPVMEDDTECMLYISSRTDGIFITRAFLDYPVNSRQDLIDIEEWTYNNGYNSLNPMGDKVQFVGRFVVGVQDTSSRLLRYMDNIFEDVAEIPFNSQVDSAQPLLVSTYGQSEETNSGNIIIYDPSFTVIHNVPILPATYVYAVRSISETLSGIANGILFCQKDNLNIGQVEFNSDWTYFTVPEIFETFAGEVTAVETTNNQPIPYILVAVFEDTHKFYQRDAIDNPSETVGTFEDVTHNLPNVKVNIIRADDLM